MLRDIRKNKIFNRRALILGSSHALLSGILLSRLSYLQLFKYKDYSIQSDSNRIKTIVIPAPRGNIYDRSGISLTENKNSYRLLLYLGKQKKFEKIIDRLSKILDLKDENKKIFLNRIQRSSHKSAVSLVDNLRWDDLARIESNHHNLPGISIESGIIRTYKYPSATAHFLGYVSLPSENEINGKEESLYMHPDFRLGKFGLEKSYDNYLRGQYGIKYVEVNSKDIPIRTLSQKNPKKGGDINSTIDLELQNFIYNRLKGLIASVVVMGVDDGGILSYNSSPSFDINNFVEGASLEYWRQVSTDPDLPLNNRPIAAIYPPGSTFKMMVALAALESGYNPATKYRCRGYYKLGGRKFYCWKKTGHGTLDMMGAIKHSCNAYFFEVANKIGYKKFADMALRFGYGKSTDIILQGENSGNVPDFAWKKRVIGVNWVGGDTLNAAIGQGFLLATPMQMVVVTCAIANGGFFVKPHFIKKNTPPTRKKIIKNDDYIKFVQEAMFKVVNEKGGTAFYRRLRGNEFKVAGKTGTSQVISRKKGDKENEDSKFGNHAIFVGFAPYDKPKYSISVVVEHGGGGSAVAAPIAMDIMKYIRDNIL